MRRQEDKDQNCDNCRFSVRPVDTPECRRNSASVTMGLAFGVWPEVDESDWCGEWEEGV